VVRKFALETEKLMHSLGLMLVEAELFGLEWVQPHHLTHISL
jgi:hypothetical protein